MTKKTPQPKMDPALFISDEVHEREIVLGDKKKHLFYIKEQEAGVLYAFTQARSEDNAERHADAAARLVAKSVCDSEGNPVLSVPDAKRLKLKVLSAMVTAIMEVHSDQGKEAESNEEAADTSAT